MVASYSPASDFHRAPASPPPSRGAAFAADGRPASSKEALPGPAFSSITIHRSVEAARSAWEALLPESLSTPYQWPGLLGAWARHVALEENAAPFVVVAHDATSAPVALLPFCTRARAGLTIARFMGGSHVNYNLPVIRRDRLEAFTASECLRLLRAAAKAGGVDAYVLRNQPESWEGDANPFAALPRQPSPDPAFSGPLASSLEEHLKLYMSYRSRTNQRRKMRRFEERGAPRMYRADTPEARARLLDAYLQQKSRQFAARGIGNVFEEPGVRAFLAESAAIDGGAPAIELFGFDLDDEVIAVTGGVVGPTRYSGMFISVTWTDHAKYSPGEMLMNFVTSHAIERGLKTLDLGVGAAYYKKAYCPNADPLYDSIIGMSAAGRAAAALAKAKTSAKAAIKANPMLYGAFQRLRKLRARTDERTEAAEAD